VKSFNHVLPCSIIELSALIYNPAVSFPKRIFEKGQARM
jgi:hypothetical protein